MIENLVKVMIIYYNQECKVSIALYEKRILRELLRCVKK